jgi:hypothetical protein
MSKHVSQKLSNWASHVSGLGPSFMKIWACGSSPRIGFPKCLKQKRQRFQSSEQRLDFYFPFGTIQLISCRDWWLWTKTGCITMTRRQTTIKGVATSRPTRPLNSEWKYPLEKFHLDILASTRHSLHWLSSKAQNYQRGVLIIPAGAIEEHFEGEKPREFD